MTRILSILFLAAGTLAVPTEKHSDHADCPPIHIFGARETSAPPGYGHTALVVNETLKAYPNATSEAIQYPACGVKVAACGRLPYNSSEVKGIAAASQAINSFNKRCPKTQLVLVGYSQGSQVLDDVLCGGGDIPEGYSNTTDPLTKAAQSMVKAAIWMGDPRFVAHKPYDVGTCKNSSGFAARPSNFTCKHASVIQSYCDEGDPACCHGKNNTVHNSYAPEYGPAAFKFIQSKLQKV